MRKIGRCQRIGANQRGRERCGLNLICLIVKLYVNVRPKTHTHLSMIVVIVAAVADDDDGCTLRIAGNCWPCVPRKSSSPASNKILCVCCYVAHDNTDDVNPQEVVVPFTGACEIVWHRFACGECVFVCGRASLLCVHVV